MTPVPLDHGREHLTARQRAYSRLVDLTGGRSLDSWSREAFNLHRDVVRVLNLCERRMRERDAELGIECGPGTPAGQWYEPDPILAAVASRATPFPAARFVVIGLPGSEASWARERFMQAGAAQ